MRNARAATRGVGRGYFVVIVQAVPCPSTLQIGACNCATCWLFAS